MTTDTRDHVLAPPFPDQELEPPGLERDMEPRPDSGEETYRGTGRLTGRRAIVTGGDSGIGRAVALAFAREGADLLISYLSEREDADETAHLVREAGRNVLTVAGDIGEEDHCRQLVRLALDALGGVDIVVNNAAWQAVRPSITEISTEEWDRIISTNIDALFFLTRAAWPHLGHGASVINTTSIQAYQPSADLLAYATTKGAIVTFTKALALEGASRGVRVNAVAPGPVWTPLIAASTSGGEVSDFGRSNPMGRPAQPAELAPVYVFLASDEASYVNGEVIGVTGGQPMP